jgi:hypothetical protein
VTEDQPDQADRPVRPALRVVRGDPTAEELAALVAVLGARAAVPGAAPASPRSAWNAPAGMVRRQVSPGPDGWRRSALPG